MPTNNYLKKIYKHIKYVLGEIDMYRNYNKVHDFLCQASNLLETKRTFKDIYESIFTRNSKAKAVEFFDLNDKLSGYSYSKLKKNILNVSGYIQSIIGKDNAGKPVVLKVSNSPLWIECFWGILMAGYTPLLVDARANKDGTQNLINQSKAVGIVTDDYNPYSVNKVLVDEIDVDEEYTVEPLWGNEVIFCSSGTTGDVKLMVFNGENICHQVCCSLNMAEETEDIMYPEKCGPLRILAMVPFHHIFGFVAVFLWYTFYGKTLVFPKSNAPTDIQEACKKGNVTHIYSVPLLWDGLAQSLKRKAAMMPEKTQKLLNNMIAYNAGKISKKEAGLGGSNIAKKKIQKMLLGTKVRYCISGGGFISTETLTTINGVGYPLYNGYGMTEIGVTSVELSKDVKTRLEGKIGHPLNGVKYKLINCNADGEGELMVKSPTIHVREIIGGNERPTSLDEDGYFKTGDIALIDDTDRVSLKGRIKDVIINSDGENVFPDELEIHFKSLPHVNHLSVLGVADGDNHKEKIVLVLEMENNVSDDELKQIQEDVKNIETRLPYNVKIGDIYLSKGKLPLANNMKVKRFVIKGAIESNSPDYVLINEKKEVKTFKGFDQETIDEIVVPMRKIFSKVLILPEFKIEDNSHWINDLGGDSMSYVELINEVQDEFSITLPEEVLGKLASINEFVEQIALLKKEGNK